MAVSTKVPFVLIGASEQRQTAVQSSARNVGHMAAATPEIPEELEELGVLLVLISDELGTQKATGIANSLRYRGDYELILLSDSQSTDLLRAAMRAGCRDVVSARDRDALDSIFDRAEKVLDQREENGDILAMIGSRGGVGATTAAIALAELLSRDSDNRVVLVDLDQGACFLPTLLGVTPTYSTHDLILALDRMAPGDIRRAVSPFREDGFHLLPLPAELPDSLSLGEEDLDLLIRSLKRSFTHVVLDLGSRMSEPERAVLRHAEHIYLLTTQSISALRPAVRRLDLLRRINADAGLHLVVNRYSNRDEPSQEQIAEQLKTRILATVQEDAAVPKSQDESQTLHTRAPNARAAKDLERLLHPLQDEEAVPNEKPKRRWWPLS